MVQDYGAVDEALVLATALVAAGTAGVVSTLWEVDDFATALIMSKFYEGIFQSNMAPAAALREAQLWIRDAQEEVIDAYASSRPRLRALRGRSKVPGASKKPAPYSDPSFWAASVFTGA